MIKKTMFAFVGMLVISINITAISIAKKSCIVGPTLFQAIEDDSWILIGEVTLTHYSQSPETIIAKLYIREIGQKLIYRVEYQGEYYATRWHDDSKTYYVTINGKTYRCDVPAISSNDNNDNRDVGKLAGKWKDNVGWYVDISFNGGRYGYSLNPNRISEIVEFQENSNGVVFTYVEKIDKRPELIKKGWKYYYNERDNKADPGYPTSGRYEYDREVVYWTVSITLSDDVPIRKYRKMHTYYYLGNMLTYADTDTDFNVPGFTTKLTRF